MTRTAFEVPIYWRRVGATGSWHAFEKIDSGSRSGRGRKYESLCGKHQLDRSYGAASERPEPVLRCGLCDGEEMRIRDWDESGPTLMPRLGVAEEPE